MLTKVVKQWRTKEKFLRVDQIKRDRGRIRSKKKEEEEEEERIATANPSVCSNAIDEKLIELLQAFMIRKPNSLTTVSISPR
ncbi:MAG: hypothetical protein ACI8RD_004475 [Bacillariaceae sp.]|jgi:hypothetical protein